MVVKEAIDILKSKSCIHDKKAAAYASLVSTVKDAMWEKELGAHGSELLKLLYQDILDTDEKIVLNALHVLNVCLEFENIGSSQKSESELAIKSLIHCGQKIPSVDVIKCIFDCLAVQCFRSDVLSNEISVLLGFIEEMNLKIKAQSVSVVDKIVKIFVRLEEQIGKTLRPSSPRWARLVFPGLVNASQDMRDESVSLLEKFREDLCGAQDLSMHIIKALNAGLANSLNTLMSTHESYVLRAWSLIVQVAGKELHKGSTINSLLEIIEIGFKGTHVGRHNAFIAWRSLINNFALDRALLLDPKRIKLLLMVLKIDNAKVEHVAAEKLLTWWHFCSCIGAKLAMNFEMIVHPLLQFCVGNGKLQCVSELGQTPRLALKTSVINTSLGPQSSVNVKNNLPVFPSVQKLGCEVIAHLVSKVGKSEDPGKVTWTIDALSYEVLASPATFVKHAPMIMTALQKLLINVGNGIEDNLVLHIWTSLGNHLKATMDSSLKTECRDIYSNYLTILHSMVQNQVLQAQTVLKMIQICCSFPQKVLASTAYNITGGQTVRGCPAQLLSEVLLTSCVMENSGAHDNFIKLFSTLVSAGASNLQGALLFLQTVTEMLDSHAQSLVAIELFWKLWNTLAHTLQDTINTTNEVNQGDALEYNFGCMYAVLLLPVKHQLSSKMSQSACKALLKTWKELYHSFARLSALVATAEANSCLEEMSAKIIENWNTELQDPANLDFMSNLCTKMLDCVDFSAISVGQSPGGGLTLSPSKWVRRRQRPMGNLHSFVHLLANLQNELNSALSKADDSGSVKKQDSVGSITLAAHMLVDLYTKLFSHITSTNVISNCLRILASPLARLYQPNTKASSVKLFVPSFYTKLEKLWQEIAQCITGRYNGQYDSELLGHLSPLMEVTFLHTRRTIKNQALTLWNTTFGRMPTVEYPSSLKHTLIKMKEKNTIILPGLISNDETAVVAETPFTEMSMGDSQVPAPALPCLASPKRQKGSLLGRDLSPAGKLSPKPKPSPVKVVSPKEVRNLFSGTRKRIELDSLPRQAFVVIESPFTKRKRLLTEHQKEVLKQKCVLPAMYNSIDSSQDISLMSQFGTETQQSVSSADVIVINSTESQQHTNELLKPTKNVKDQEKCGSPQHLLSDLSSRRRSVRIQELQSSNSAELICSEVKSGEDSAVMFIETYLNQEVQSESVGLDEKMRNGIDKDDKKDILEPQGCGSVTFVPLDPSKTHSDTFNGCDGTNDRLVPECDDKNLDAPFLMFRTKQQTGSKITLSQNSISTKSPRRVSLRKVRSQDDIPLAKLDEEAPLSPKTVKTPRRVPLKKINEQDRELDSESHKTSLGEKAQESSLSKIRNWFGLSEERDNKAEVLTESPSSAPELKQLVESDCSIDVSCTLVEDTQSPFKVKQQSKKTDHSIAETPLKSDSSSSPPVRAGSARKLFVDCDTEIDSQMQMDDSGQAVESTARKEDNKNTEIPQINNSEITSSQGFEMASDILTSEENMLESSHANSGKEGTKVDHCASDVPSAALPESENLFPNTQNSISSLDMMMPTISSPLENRFKSNSLSSSSESHKASSTGSSEPSDKQSSSSDSDFVCSQPTLVDEGTYTPNKRKRGTPKKLLQVKNKRSNGRLRKTKRCNCCKNVIASCHCKFESVSEVDNEADGGKINSPLSLSLTSQDVNASTPLPSLTDAVLLPDAPVNSEDSEAEFIKIDTLLQENGEITPDMKSPRSNPERRHSTVKRMGQLPKRKLENVDANKSASKKIRVESPGSDNSDSAEKVGKRKDRAGVDGWKKRPKPVSPDEKRKSAMSSKQFHKNKHLLKTRNKRSWTPLSDNQDLSLKKRKLAPNGHEPSDDEDSLPLSLLKKSEIDGSESLNTIDDIDADDTPLSNLVNTPAGIEDSQKSDVTDSSNQNNTQSLTYSNVDSLIIDDAVNTALQEVLLESTVAKVNQNEHFSSVCVDKALTAVCSSLESLATDKSTDTSQEYVQSAQQQILSLTSSTGEVTKAPAIVQNIPTDSACSDAVENVGTMKKQLYSYMCELITDRGLHDDAATDNTEDKELENSVFVEIPQPDIAVEKCINSGSYLIVDEQSRPDEDVIEPQSKTCSDELNPVQEDKEDTTEHIIETERTEPQRDIVRSPERNVCIVYDWSPTRSPSCSILKRYTETSPSGKSRRVSFAEPVVSGESPVRECYKEFSSASPMISLQTSSPGQKMTLFNRSQGKGSKYRRRLESSKRQEPSRSFLARKIMSPQTQPSYKPTQESQLDNSGPVFPELVGCTNPLDDILPQLTSSLWYRGLCQMMKGRNINTIGDLCSLTEVQIDQLPIRHPKVESVKSTLNAYMAQHGLAKLVSSVENTQEGCKSPRSKGSTIEQEVTPASIDDEGTQIHPNADKDLKQLSPIRDLEGAHPKLCPLILEMDGASNFSPLSDGDSTPGELEPQAERSSPMLSSLKQVVKQSSNLKKVSLVELFDIHQTLNLLFTNVVEEMKARQPKE